MPETKEFAGVSRSDLIYEIDRARTLKTGAEHQCARAQAAREEARAKLETVEARAELLAAFVRDAKPLIMIARAHIEYVGGMIGNWPNTVETHEWCSRARTWLAALADGKVGNDA